MIKKCTVTQAVLSWRQLAELLDFDRHPQHDLFRVYQNLNLSKSRETDVAAAIGMMALNDVLKIGIPMAVIAQRVEGLMNAGLNYLAMNIELWHFGGSTQTAEAYRSWLSNGDEHTRRLRIQELLNIFERRSSRFLFLNPAHLVATANDSDTWFGQTNQRVTFVLDAFAYANEVRKRRPGPLFVIQAEDEK